MLSRSEESTSSINESGFKSKDIKKEDEQVCCFLILFDIIYILLKFVRHYYFSSNHIYDP